MRVAAALAGVVFLVGCAGPIQQPVALNPSALVPQAGRIGVAMTALPKVEVRLPGADCLLCMAAASLATSSLNTHAQTLPHEDLPKLKQSIAALIQKKGTEVVVLGEDIDLDKIPDLKAQGDNVSVKDFSALQQKYRIDKLLVIRIHALGFERNYASYIPTGDPKAMFRGVGYMVNLKTNTYEWYQPVSVMKSSDGPWDEPPKFPGLTNAYFQAIELGKDDFHKSFRN